MRRNRFWSAVAIVTVIITVAACAQRDEGHKSWGNDTWSDGGEPTESAIRFEGAAGDFGEIVLAFMLRPTDDTVRSIKAVEYKGACAGDEWTSAVVSGETAYLRPGRHEITWHSWDSEAGCAGEVEVRLTTNRGEAVVSPSFSIDNTTPGRTGFADFPQFDQGINPSEEQVYLRALDALMADPSVDFAATRIDDLYEILAARGSVWFRRVPTHRGYDYEIADIDGENPIANQDPTWGASFEEEMALGANPNNASWPEEGYDPGDPRLSFIEPDNDSYPFGYERIAAYFDSPNAADVLINWKGYAHSVSYVGNHGSLNISQSRSPLLAWGAGIKPGRHDVFARHVDIAPTVGALLGFEPTGGIDERGVFSHDVLLHWQDGHPLDEMLTGEGAAHAIVIVMDGLTHTRIVDEVEKRPGELPNFARFFDEGGWAGYGSITNWPSVTYPGHNVVGSGLYSGHHGILDNEFYIRTEREYAEPINQLILSEKYWNPLEPGETLHAAVHRNFGKYKPEKGKGALTASLTEPSTFDADKADLKFRDRTGEIPFPPLGLYWPPGIPNPNPSLMHTSTFLAQFVEEIAMIEMWHLFFNGAIPRPTYVIMNFMTTDDSGHKNGPHGDQMSKVLDHLDKNLGLVFDWLEIAGMADDTAVFITSDHGMQLGDPTRGGWPIDSLDAAGIKRSAETYLGVYFKNPRVFWAPLAAESGEATTFEITVQDDDLGTAIEGATVTLTSGVTNFSAVTDANGKASITITPGDDLVLTVAHPDYTDMKYDIAVD
ncbi:MAG: alkaline phosphatase family protein [Deltaproteobacteria bacterium]|nr:alkaline phosphatase family protein [Deltaproteobacteria bacterium]